MEFAMGLETHSFDIADELHDDEALAIYLDEALQTGDPAYFAHSWQSRQGARDDQDGA